MCSHETALPAASPFSSSKTFPETFLGVSPSRLPPQPVQTDDLFPFPG